MPAGSRIRANNVIGSITDNPLGSGAVSFNSSLLTLLPAVVGNHAVITLDPLRQYGNPEIVIVTAHTAASTTATITRAAYGTSARAHPMGTVWIHAPMNEDVVPILTSSTRPADPYLGELIYETDTNVYKSWNGSTWITSGSLDDSGWTAMPYLNGWVTYDSITYGPAGYRKIGKIVYLRGLVKSGNIALSLAQLPVGYRPGLGKTRVITTSNELYCQLDIASDGNILPVSGVSTAWVSLNNISFIADN